MPQKSVVINVTARTGDKHKESLRFKQPLQEYPWCFEGKPSRRSPIDTFTQRTPRSNPHVQLTTHDNLPNSIAKDCAGDAVHSIHYRMMGMPCL